MLKILSAEQIRLADQFTIENEPISSIDLMERASIAFVSEFEKLVEADKSIVVLSGTGNNGGDGLAIARILISKGYDVSAHLIMFSEAISNDCRLNLGRLDGQVLEVNPSNFCLPEADVVIDALLGSGLNRPVSGDLARVIEMINESNSQVISVDIPSGLSADEANLEGAVVKADYTVTFQAPKLSFLIPETGKFVGTWVAVDIGLDQQFIAKQKGNYFLMNEKVMSYLSPREKFQHKGDFGRVQVFAGSLGKMGAAFLCSKAVLRSGAGLLTVHTPECGMQILQSSLPEAMLTIDSAYEHISSVSLLEETDVVCFGPGIGQHNKTAEALRLLLSKGPEKLVIDADGLNIISQHPELLDMLPEGTILTPHVGEFHRLFGVCKNGMDRITIAQKMAKRLNVVIVLKGAHSAIVSPNEDIFFNNTGNPGMATAGSGDVLAGMITGLLSQGLSSLQAACLGVYLHGKAGDLAKKTLGEVSLMASDLLEFVPKAISNV